MGLLDYLHRVFKRKEEVGDEKRDIKSYSTEELREKIKIREELTSRYLAIRYCSVGEFGVIPQCAREAGYERKDIL